MGEKNETEFFEILKTLKDQRKTLPDARRRIIIALIIFAALLVGIGLLIGQIAPSAFSSYVTIVGTIIIGFIVISFVIKMQLGNFEQKAQEIKNHTQHLDPAIQQQTQQQMMNEWVAEKKEQTRVNNRKWCIIEFVLGLVGGLILLFVILRTMH